jgi:hypothetical protein
LLPRFQGTCPGTSNCSRITLNADMETFWMGCHATGPTPVGADCIGVDECVGDSYCWGGVCRALCDAAHPCTAGTCEHIAGLPSAGGVCR